MAAATLITFAKQLSAELKPVYLIAGSEHLLVLEAADAIRARAREAGYSEREVLDVDASFDWNRFGAASSNLSLFSSQKLIDLRLPTGRPGKEGSEAISAFCASPPSDTLLLITATDWSKAHETAWVKVVERIGVYVPVWPLKREELPSWIKTRMTRAGLKPTAEAITLLAERVEGNLLAAAQEIDKLALLVGANTLDATTLENNVIDDARFDAFRLMDAAIAGDSTRALRILAGLRAEGEELIPLLGWMLNQLRLLLKLAEAGPKIGDVFRAERVWDSKQGLYRQALKKSDRQHWEHCLIQAGRIDRIAKGRRSGNAWREFERLLAAVAIPHKAQHLLA